MLPQTFQTTDFVRLLAELALALIRLRSMLPEDLPEQAAERWLDTHHPGWAATLPLRMSPEIAEQLIRPALGSARGVRTVAGGPLAVRKLRRDQAGCWRWFLRLNEDGFLPDALLPGADGLRLRLLAVGGAIETADAPVYLAAPEPGGWRVRRFGRSGRTSIPFAPLIPFILGAFADGRKKTEVVIAPGVPDRTRPRPSGEPPIRLREAPQPDRYLSQVRGGHEHRVYGFLRPRKPHRRLGTGYRSKARNRRRTGGYGGCPAEERSRSECVITSKSKRLHLTRLRKLGSCRLVRSSRAGEQSGIADLSTAADPEYSGRLAPRGYNCCLIPCCALAHRAAEPCLASWWNGWRRERRWPGSALFGCHWRRGLLLSRKPRGASG